MATDIPYTFEKRNKVIQYSAGDAEKPLVLLLHGAGGDINDMTAPDETTYPHYDYEAAFPANRDEGWRAYPGIGIWSFELDPAKEPLESWQDALNKNGFSTAAYSQVDSTGPLARSVAELKVVIKTLNQPPASIEGVNLPSKQLVILAHSRGGLLARKFLKDHADLVPNLIKVITLDSPHTGSELANLALDFANLIAAFPSKLQELVESALGSFATLVEEQAWQELSVGSAFLTDLQNGEAALSGVQYFTFGGVSVKVTRLLSWAYTLGSAIPQWHWPPFHHVITMTEVPVLSPVLDSLPPLTDEITKGKGDILTADKRCQLPFATHRTNEINHAECLWDPGLQAQVLAILSNQMGFWE